MDEPAERPTYSFVIPVYNEEEVLPELYRRMRALIDDLDGPSEIVFVDDGSRDRSYPLMLELYALDPRFKAVHFSRNFGKEVAVSAGLDLASGEAVVLMDADLQDPPELVRDMAVRWREGYDIVYAKRDRRVSETWFKRQSSKTLLSHAEKNQRCGRTARRRRLSAGGPPRAGRLSIDART